MNRLSRRTFLRGAAGAAVGLPLLGAMQGSADALELPRRLVFFFFPLGRVKDSWSPVGTPNDYQLGEILAPLAQEGLTKDDVIVLEGIDMISSAHGPGDDHQKGIGQVLTATELQYGDLFQYGCMMGTVGWGGGISVDQHLANELKKNEATRTMVPSLELGVGVQNGDVGSRLCYAGPAAPVTPDDDPWNVYASLFADLAADPTGVAKVKAQRQRVLDAILPDYHALSARLGKDDKQRLELHVSALADIETQLSLPGGALGGACQLPAMPPLPGDLPQALYGNDNFPGIGKLQMDLLSMALVCDLTRVATVQWSTVGAGKVFSWLGQSSTHHELSHAPHGDGADPEDLVAKGQLVQIGTWFAEQLAYLARSLKAVPEGNGTALDNTMIVWCSDLSNGWKHSHDDMPFVIVGGKNCGIGSGRWLEYQGASHSDLLVSLCHAMGVPVSSFGNPEYGSGPLPGLLV